jgi:hypothetical protein
MSKRVVDLLVDTLQLVMPPSPLIAPEAVIGVAFYRTRAVLQGEGHDVWEMARPVASSPHSLDPGSLRPVSPLPRNRPPSHHNEVAAPITANRDWRTSSEDGYTFERQSNGKRT